MIRVSKKVVIYASHYGYTQKYANWIAQALQCEVVNVSELDEKNLTQCDVIIWGGGLYASGINGIKQFKKLFPLLRQKKLIVFTVGLASVDDPEPFKQLVQQNFDQEQIDRIQFYHFRGGMDYKRLSFTHRSMMAALRRVILMKKEQSEDAKGILDTYGKTIDMSNRDAIQPLLDYVNQ